MGTDPREKGGGLRNPAPGNHFLARICQTIRPPLRRWALDKRSCHRGLKDIVECRHPLGAPSLSPNVIVRAHEQRQDEDAELI